MIIYMTHPYHGTHIAHDTGEVKRCEANGWTFYGPNPPPKRDGVTDADLKAWKTPAAAAPVAAPVEKNKPGRKPKA